MNDYAKLQNGSDVRGVALAGVPGEAITLSPEKAGVITRAFTRWLGKKKGKVEIEYYGVDDLNNLLEALEGLGT